MLTREFADRFAHEWIEAWNSRDLDRVLSHYRDDFTMSSPKIAAVTGESSGVLTGKDAIGAYWKRALELAPDLHFELLSALLGADSIVLHYTNSRGQAAEVFFFDSAGLVVRAAANYASP